MKLDTTFLFAIILILLFGCNQPGSENNDVAISDSITIKKIDSLKSLLVHLNSRVEFANSDSLSLIAQGIIQTNRNLLELMPAHQFLDFSKKMKKGDISRRINELEQNRIKKVKELYKGMVWVGMTDKEAIWSIGEPDKVNRSVYSNVTKEQWVYREKEIYLYFTDGILTSYQE